MDGLRETSDGPRLLKLLEEQRSVYGRLRGLSRRQRALIAGDDPDALLELLNERGGLVQTLTRLNAELTPFRRDWNATYAKLPAALQQRAKALVNDIEALMSDITKKDSEDEALLSARKSAVGNQLAGLSGGRVANDMYAKAAQAARSNSADLTG
jgi:hypothetical protein